MKQNHSFFSNLAFDIAENNLGKTKTNPSVGCIVVKNNTIISSAVTSISGRPHAEYNALNKNLDFKGSIMYVTLEPCVHYGATPPCTNIIKRKKIKKVYYCFDDPDFRTYKKANKKLKKSKILLKKITTKNRDFYKSYFINKKENTIYIDAKIAMSRDYFSIYKKSKWITNQRSRKISHLLRSRYDTIISTSKSINKDNALLNCRLKGFDKFKPDLIIIDRKLRLRKNLKIFNISKNRKTYIFTTSNNQKKINYFKSKKIKVFKVKSLSTKADIQSFFQKLFLLGKRRVLIESGLVFLNVLIKSKLINNLYLFRSSKKLYKKGLNNTKTNLVKNFDLNKKINVNLNGDNLYKIRIK